MNKFYKLHNDKKEWTGKNYVSTIEIWIYAQFYKITLWKRMPKTIFLKKCIMVIEAAKDPWEIQLNEIQSAILNLYNFF